MRVLSAAFLLSVFVLAIGCDNKPKEPTAEEIAAESQRLNEWFDAVWDSSVARHPVWEAYQGIKDDSYDEWGDFSDSMEIAEMEITKENLAYLQANFDTALLDEQTFLSYQLWVRSVEQEMERFKYRNYNYPVNQMHGDHSWVPEFLINIHRVTNVQDAKDYITRVNGVEQVMDQLIKNMQLREENQIVPPKFVFPMVLEDSRNIIGGYPFDDSNTESPIYADIKGKIEALDSLDEAGKQQLLADAETALKGPFKNGYDKLIAFLAEQEKRATTDDGVWKFPNGDMFYESQLQKYTTTNMTADQIFKLGMDEVKRIHSEMEKIKETVGFEGTLQEFFKYVEENQELYFTNDSVGKAAYLSQTTLLIDSMKAFLPNFFGILPKAELEVKRVEPFREKSAGTAFYNRPAPDGSRPGTYYVNLYDMAIMPMYEMEALAYHEAIPGHHMQLSIAMELEGLPKFRTMGGGYTAYTEGWGLYSEYIPKEYGFYSNPYSDFGRLSMELWRACRLVVDVGIHYKRWTREEGIQFYSLNTPSPEGDCIKMVERHIVMPGQATAYKIGQLKILSLLNMSREALGDQFDIRAFHDEVLRYGSLPLDVLEDNINKWIAVQQQPEA